MDRLHAAAPYIPCVLTKKGPANQFILFAWCQEVSKMSDEKFPDKTNCLGEAASKLADTVRHVVDLCAGKERLIAKAHAQAETAIITAKADAEVSEIRARTAERILRRELRRQENIEAITLKAAQVLPPPDQMSREPVSEDWTTRFFEECQDIGEEQLQELWGRILAGEVARPKSFSPHTLRVVKDLQKEDAELFSKLCKAVWHVPGAGFVPVVHDMDNDPFAAEGLRFVSLLHLSTLGLIEINKITGFTVKSQPSFSEIGPQYCGTVYKLFSANPAGFPVGHVMLTAAGQQLLNIANAKADEAFRKSAIDGWAARGWKLRKPNEAKAA